MFVQNGQSKNCLWFEDKKMSQDLLVVTFYIEKASYTFVELCIKHPPGGGVAGNNMLQNHKY